MKTIIIDNQRFINLAAIAAILFEKNEVYIGYLNRDSYSFKVEDSELLAKEYNAFLNSEYEITFNIYTV